MKTIVLLTAGTGSRMGKYSTIINKTLLPINDKAIISHIIEQFPHDTRFVVALGYKGDMVQDYLEIAHSDRVFEFVNVDNYDQPGSGPSYSLQCCRQHLPESFMLIACDAYYEGLADIPCDKNYVGVSKVDVKDSPSYCNVTLDGDRISSVVDKLYCESGLAVNGVFYIKDAANFWKHLGGIELSTGWAANETYAIQIPWQDLGTFEKYQNFLLKGAPYDFSKTDEFLYIVNGRVIKWFRDYTITSNRVSKVKGRQHLFPVIDFQKDGWYSYKFVPGEVLYKCIDQEVFENFLSLLSTEVWVPHTDKKITPEMCADFYHTKTMKRLQSFRDKYPDFNPKVINGKVMRVDIDNGLNLIDWHSLLNTDLEIRSKFFHGDLQFDNVLYDGNKFTLLDWRQDFAGCVEIGDVYYDAAKLLGGMILNYDLIRQNKFHFEENGDVCNFNAAQRAEHGPMKQRLKELLPSPIIENIVTLIFLNMAPLHAAPFDKLLFCLALERLNDLT